MDIRLRPKCLLVIPKIVDFVQPTILDIDINGIVRHLSSLRATVARLVTSVTIPMRKPNRTGSISSCARCLFPRQLRGTTPNTR